MKNQKKIMLTIFTLMTMLPAYADDDCQQNWTEACVGNPYGLPPNVSNAGDKLFLLGGLGIAAYFYLSADSTDPMTYTRLLNDYKQGRGLRLTSYDNDINVSLLAINRNSHSSRFHNSPSTANYLLEDNPRVSLNLIAVSTEY